MSVDSASMTSGRTGEIPVETLYEGPVETPADLPASLGVVGYAAFALLRPIPLNEIAPFPLVVTAFEAEAGCHVSEPQPQPEEIVAVLTAPLPPAPAPAVTYAVGGYRPTPVPQTWARDLPVLAPEPDCAPPEVEAPADDSAPQEMAPLGELDRLSVGVMAVPAGESFRIGGYAANRASADQQARQVLDELSFLFDGN